MVQWMAYSQLAAPFRSLIRSLSVAQARPLSPGQHGTVAILTRSLPAPQLYAITLIGVWILYFGIGGLSYAFICKLQPARTKQCFSTDPGGHGNG